jgi:hypothetical protein
MNTQKVREIIKLYKRHFKYIHKEEIYKWRAVKCFQDNWNINADDFASMLESSLHLSKNLLDSQNYLPKINLLRIARNEPEKVRQFFKNLHNENDDLIERVEKFLGDIKVLYKKHFPDMKDFQDHRSVFVYLSLRFPEIYYLYKFTMFKAFVQMVDYPHQPTTGDLENVLQFLTLCNLLKAEIIKDPELLELHQTRITEKEYRDTSFNLLTQDIIYAAVRHIDKFEQKGEQEPATTRLIKIDKNVNPKKDKVVLKGSFTNYIENEKENKRIGDLGELLVLQHEQEKLKSFGIKKQPEHQSKSKGDGLGFDILSYNEKGEEIFIEVKTTVRNYDTPFFITRNELEKSKQDSDKFFLYRLYEFDDTNNTANYYERKGNLSDLCVNAILYRALV